jgi:hypothetical protein
MQGARSGAVLAEAGRNPSLAREAAMRARPAAAPSVTVAAVLHVDADVMDMPTLHTDMARGSPAEFAYMAGLRERRAHFGLLHSDALVSSTGDSRRPHCTKEPHRAKHPPSTDRKNPG